MLLKLTFEIGECFGGKRGDNDLKADLNTLIKWMLSISNNVRELTKWFIKLYNGDLIESFKFESDVKWNETAFMICDKCGENDWWTELDNWASKPQTYDVIGTNDEIRDEISNLLEFSFCRKKNK